MDKDKKDLIKFSIIMGTLAIIALILIFSSYRINIANSKPTKVIDPYHDHITTSISLEEANNYLQTKELSYRSKDGLTMFFKGGERINIYCTRTRGSGVVYWAALTKLPKYSGAYPIEYSQVEEWR